MIEPHAAWSKTMDKKLAIFEIVANAIVVVVIIYTILL